mmetsp:Transcript_26655/g.47232  ORF Transcript_26655/g.47232 Transcript_26655/m.47232 type:complete len:287 (+) Transcript_26655:387-1247(+)
MSPNLKLKYFIKYSLSTQFEAIPSPDLILILGRLHLIKGLQINNFFYLLIILVLRCLKKQPTNFGSSIGESNRIKNLTFLRISSSSYSSFRLINGYVITTAQYSRQFKEIKYPSSIFINSEESSFFFKKINGFINKVLDFSNAIHTNIFNSLLLEISGIHVLFYTDYLNDYYIKFFDTYNITVISDINENFIRCMKIDSNTVTKVNLKQNFVPEAKNIKIEKVKSNLCGSYKFTEIQFYGFRYNVNILIFSHSANSSGKIINELKNIIFKIYFFYKNKNFLKCSNY